MILTVGLFIFIAVIVMTIAGNKDSASKHLTDRPLAKVQIKRVSQDSAEGLARKAELALRRNELESGLSLLQQAIDSSATKQDQVHYRYQYYLVLNSVRPESATSYWEEHRESFQHILGKRETDG